LLVILAVYGTFIIKVSHTHTRSHTPKKSLRP
jgi:hypothetical protein